MNNVSGFPPRLSVVGAREGKGTAGISPMKSTLVSSYPVSEVEQYRRYEGHLQAQPMRDWNGAGRRTVFPEDRRKSSLHAGQQTMPVEFRSGRNRRRRHQRGSEIVEHIDEKA